MEILNIINERGREEKCKLGVYSGLAQLGLYPLSKKLTTPISLTMDIKNQTIYS